jgi:DNA replication factor GINS
VENTNIDAKEGDISLLSRWVAKILFNANMVEIHDNEASSYISRSLNRERIARPHDLASIDVDFYIRVNDYISGLKERERENLMMSLNSFVATRLEKIVKFAAASTIYPELEAKLSVEEKQLYTLTHDFTVDFKQRVMKKFD